MKARVMPIVNFIGCIRDVKVGNNCVNEDVSVLEWFDTSFVWK